MSLPGWLDPLSDAEAARAADRWAIEVAGVPSLRLMEAASLGLARSVARLARPGLPIRILIGTGNNGGDGLAAARLLREEGREVDVLAAGDLDRIGGDALVNLERLPGAAPRPLRPDSLEGSGAIVDAIVGTGFAGALRGPVAAAAAAIAVAEGPVIACDVPTGVDASTGEVADGAVRADATVTFHGSKVGLHVAPGAAHAGEVEVVDIGIPRGAPSVERHGLISSRVLALYPSRPRFGSKFDSGVVLVAGGARGYAGAPAMAARAAQRAGAGYVQVAVPGSIEPAVAAHLLEAMPRSLAEIDGAHCSEGAEALLELAGRAGSVVLGPGLGRSGPAVAFARAAAADLERPTVIDADGLNAHAGLLESLAGRSAATVLTPHAGELGRLLGIEAAEVERHRLASAAGAAAASGAVVVLKGDDSIVAAPDGRIAISPGATPALATAGTGDVLAGLIGTLLAKGLGPFEAAALGVLGHARAGLEAAARRGADHVVAGDVIDALPVGLRAR